ncbi:MULTISPECIES: hypothetical protein [unclassified Nonomuraea]|uniref:hypothetical protein n=1 Tax=unclassified Nonomuraea TaxID=2593643 RepID=UPI0033D26348
MSQLLAQLPALLGVVVGALATLATTRAADRARWNREMRTRWDAQRLDAYMQYAGTLKDLSVLAHRATARRRPGARSEPIDDEEVGRLYAAAEDRRTRTWEGVLLLGDAATVEAARAWRGTIERLNDFTRGVTDDWESWGPAVRRVDEARDAYYGAARRSLVVGGGEVPQATFLGRTIDRPEGRGGSVPGE